MEKNISMQYSKLIRSMADELNKACHEQEKFKTVSVYRKTLIQLIEFISIKKNITATDVADDINISRRTWMNIKNNNDLYVSIRKKTIETLIRYVYDFAERVEQSSFMTV